MHNLPPIPGRGCRASFAARTRSWSRYERLAFAMLGYTWGLLIAAVAALFFFNRELETHTSSTSSSHSTFFRPTTTQAQEARDDHTP